MNGKAILGLLGLGFIIGYWYTLYWFVTTFVLHAHLTVGGIVLGILAIFGFAFGAYLSFVVVVLILALIIAD